MAAVGHLTDNQEVGAAHDPDDATDRAGGQGIGLGEQGRTQALKATKPAAQNTMA